MKLTSIYCKQYTIHNVLNMLNLLNKILNDILSLHGGYSKPHMEEHMLSFRNSVMDSQNFVFLGCSL